MEFKIENFIDKKFNLCLMTNIENFPYLKELDYNDNIIFLNPEYIISVYHIWIAINRSLYNFNILKKHKSDKLKKEIVYFTLEKSRVDLCNNLHRINIENPTSYILFIDHERNQIEKIKSDLKGLEILPENYSSYVDLEKIKKEFDIKEEEIENDGGIIGAVYNRIAIKDLK